MKNKLSKQATIKGEKMGLKSAKKYNLHQASRVVGCIECITKRINVKYTPYWLLHELDVANHNAQCIQQEFEKQLEDCQ